MKRALLAVCVVAAALPGLAAGAGPRLAVDSSDYPTIRATVVTPTPLGVVPKLKENGKGVVGLRYSNLGRQKSVVLVVDRSQSMRGQALTDATAAASRFVRTKPRSDRITVVAVGSQAVQLTGFSTAPNEAVGALRGLEVDPVVGTDLYDSVVLASQALAGEFQGGRVIILLTDGQEVSSETSLNGAIDAARAADVAVYPIGIESKSFRPAPLERLAAATGGRYVGAQGTAALQGIYAALAEELRRTWQLSYLTAARPGEPLELSAAGATERSFVPGRREVAKHESSKLPDAFYEAGPVAPAALVGLCVLVSAMFFFRAPIGSRLRRRIEPHLGEERRKRVRGPVQERFATASAVLRATERAFGHLRAWHALHRLLERADVPLRTAELVYAAVGAGFAAGIVCAAAGFGGPAALVAMIVGASIPILVVWYKARRRLAAIEDQLPDLLVTMAASLKAGHSFRQGIQAVVDEGQPPASKEFKRVLTETQLGRPMDDALAEMAERVGSKNLSFVITSVAIQRQVGGSLAGIFDMVAEAVRQRQQFARKIRSLTGMGRMSAYVLCGIPFFMLAVTTLLNPEYMSPLYHTSTGHMLMATGLAMMAVGSLLLKKIVSFKG